MADNTVNQFDFFGYAYGWTVLSESAKKHDPEAFKRASINIDSLPQETLRGLAYLGWVLSQYPEEERDPTQYAIANRVMIEMNALVAAILDHQSQALTDLLITEYRPVTA